MPGIQQEIFQKVLLKMTISVLSVDQVHVN